MRIYTLVSTEKKKISPNRMKFPIIANGVKWQVKISTLRASISALQWDHFVLIAMKSH